MSETRVPVDPNQPLDAGVYDITATVQGMDARQATLSQLQKGVTNHYGDRVQVLDYSATSPSDITLRVRVNPAASPGQVQPQQVLVALIYAASIVAFGFFLWRVSINIKGTTKIVGSNPGTQIAAAGTGIGIALAGLAGLAWIVWPRKRARA